MRERYREGKIQGVVIRTLDRLSRSQTHVAILIEDMEHDGITLHSVKEIIDDTPMGKFARMVLAFVAEMEREKIMDRTITGNVIRPELANWSAVSSRSMGGSGTIQAKRIILFSTKIRPKATGSGSGIRRWCFPSPNSSGSKLNRYHHRKGTVVSSDATAYPD